MRPVVMVSLEWMREGDDRTSLGLASIVSALRGAGVHVEVVADAVNRPGFVASEFIERVIAAVAAAAPGALVGIGAYVWNEPEFQALVTALRERTDATIVLGGPQVSYVGEGLEDLYPGVHLFVRGHGEGAMVALATGGPVDGLGVHRAGEADRGEVAALDLGSLPSPYLDGTVAIGPRVRFETQRGCPFRCSFCQHREAGARMKSGRFDLARVREEISAFANAGVQRISVLDPVFHVDSARAVQIVQAIRDSGIRAKTALQCRFELVDDAFLDAVQGMNVVLEFGLQTAIEREWKLIGRPNNLGRASRVLESVQARGIDHEVSVIYGLPSQTVESFQRTVDWCLSRRVESLYAWPLMLLRGTPLHANRHLLGLVESGGRIPIVVSSPTFTREEHGRMGEIADALAGARTPKAA